MEKITIVNFRDVGGIHVPDGVLQEGMFFRSGQLTNLTQTDQSFLKDTCHLSKVFDFRGEAEISKDPDTKIAGIPIENIDILATAELQSATFHEMINSGEMIRDNMLETYHELVLCSSAQKGYQHFLEELLSLKTPILFHCFAGKDRTGFAAALILKIAGASDEQIMDDYLKTNEQRAAANQKILDEFRDQYTQKQLDALEIGLCVEANYLQYADQVMKKHYGTFENYLSEALHINADYTEEFRHAFVK